MAENDNDRRDATTLGANPTITIDTNALTAQMVENFREQFEQAAQNAQDAVDARTVTRQYRAFVPFPTAELQITVDPAVGAGAGEGEGDDEPDMDEVEPEDLPEFLTPATPAQPTAESFMKWLGKFIPTGEPRIVHEGDVVFGDAHPGFVLVMEEPNKQLLYWSQGDRRSWVKEEGKEWVKTTESRRAELCNTADSIMRLRRGIEDNADNLRSLTADLEAQRSGLVWKFHTSKFVQRLQSLLSLQGVERVTASNNGYPMIWLKGFAAQMQPNRDVEEYEPVELYGKLELRALSVQVRECFIVSHAKKETCVGWPWVDAGTQGKLCLDAGLVNYRMAATARNIEEAALGVIAQLRSLGDYGFHRTLSYWNRASRCGLCGNPTRAAQFYRGTEVSMKCLLCDKVCAYCNGGVSAARRVILGDRIAHLGTCTDVCEACGQQKLLKETCEKCGPSPRLPACAGCANTFPRVSLHPCLNKKGRAELRCTTCYRPCSGCGNNRVPLDPRITRCFECRRTCVVCLKSVGTGRYVEGADPWMGITHSECSTICPDCFMAHRSDIGHRPDGTRTCHNHQQNQQYWEV